MGPKYLSKRCKEVAKLWSAGLLFLPLLFSFMHKAPAALANQIAVANSNANVLNYEAPRSLTARIYAKKSDRSSPLFLFKRTTSRDGAVLKVNRDFTYPDGKLAAREQVIYDRDDLMLYELEELQTGARGKAKVVRDPTGQSKSKIEFSFSNGRTDTDQEILDGITLIADMVGPFLAAQWERLSAGEKVKCRYVVIPRKETVGFTFRKESELTRQGTRVVLIKMEPTSGVIAALIDPLFFLVERDGKHRVLEYVGRTTPKILVGKKWKTLDAVTVFDWD
jgi:hypothetical protein